MVISVASGRKREFDEDTALQSAMEVFWQKGYVGTSLSDLTKSMGINKPSMYSAFGNKEALFIKATQRYIAIEMKAHQATLPEQSDAPFKVRLKNYMMSIVAMQCASEQHKGCFLVQCQSELIGGDIPQNAAQLLSKAESTPKQLFVDLFTKNPEAVELGLDKNAEGNALSLYTVLKGTASMARTGAQESELEYVIDTALRGIGAQ